MDIRKKLETASATPGSLETAATKPGHVSSRTIFTKAGGTAALRKLPKAKAMTLVRKAAADLAAERKSAGKPAKVDRQELIDWVKDNCGAAPSKSKDQPARVNYKEVHEKTMTKLSQHVRDINGVLPLASERSPEIKAALKKLKQAMKAQSDGTQQAPKARAQLSADSLAAAKELKKLLAKKPAPSAKPEGSGDKGSKPEPSTIGGFKNVQALDKYVNQMVGTKEKPADYWQAREVVSTIGAGLAEAGKAKPKSVKKIADAHAKLSAAAKDPGVSERSVERGYDQLKSALEKLVFDGTKSEVAAKFVTRIVRSGKLMKDFLTSLGHSEEKPAPAKPKDAPATKPGSESTEANKRHIDHMASDKTVSKLAPLFKDAKITTNRNVKTGHKGDDGAYMALTEGVSAQKAAALQKWLAANRASDKDATKLKNGGSLHILKQTNGTYDVTYTSPEYRKFSDDYGDKFAGKKPEAPAASSGRLPGKIVTKGPVGLSQDEANALSNKFKPENKEMAQAVGRDLIKSLTGAMKDKITQAAATWAELRDQVSKSKDKEEPVHKVEDKVRNQLDKFVSKTLGLNSVSYDGLVHILEGATGSASK